MEPIPRAGGPGDARPGGAEARRIDAEPQLSMGIGTFAMLLFGQLRATVAARAGRVGVHDTGALAAWDASLATRYAPACADNF